jgi:single-strand DNA-binding protein
MPAPKTTPAKTAKPAPAPAPAPKRKAHEPVDLGEGYVSGNLTFDPELRYTPTGRAVCSLRVAETPRIKNDEGQWVDGETEFHSLDVWGPMGENCAEVFQKGDRIIAFGNWQQRFWIASDDEERSVTEMNVREIGPSLLFRIAKIDRTQRSKSY